MIGLSAKVTAIVVFAFVFIAAAALLIAGVFTAKDEAKKTFSGAHFIRFSAGLGGSRRNEREETYNYGRISEHTLVVSGGDAGRARGQGNAL